MYVISRGNIMFSDRVAVLWEFWKQKQ